MKKLLELLDQPLNNWETYRYVERKVEKFEPQGNPYRFDVSGPTASKHYLDHYNRF